MQFAAEAASNIDELADLLLRKAIFYRNIAAQGAKLIAIDSGHVLFTIPGHNTPTKEAEEVFQTIAIDVSNIPPISINDLDDAECMCDELSQCGPCS